MKSILKEFAQGNISPQFGSIKSNSHYKRTFETFSNCADKLKAELNEEFHEILHKLIDAQAEMNLISEEDKFIYGYRLGVLMTMDVFNGFDDAIYGATAEE
jgi:hypothetical protein